MIKIFLWGYYGCNNIGDDILLSLLLKKILKEKDNVIITVVVKNKYKEFDYINNVNFITNSVPINNKYSAIIGNIKFYLHHIKNSDFVIFGGGTSLFETEKTRYKSLLVKYIILLINNKLYRRPIYHIGVGVGKIETTIGKFCFKQIVRFSEFINLREKQSYEKVLSISKNKEKVSLGNDLAYLHIYDKEPKNNNNINIGISLFQYYGYISDDISKKELFYNSCKKMLKDIIDLNESIHIYLFSFQTGMGGYDQDFLQNLKDEIQNQKVHIISYSTDTDFFIKKLKTMDLCIGMRLHFLILSIIHKIPIIGLNYQPKIVYELTSLEISPFCIEIDNISHVLNIVKQYITDPDTFYSSFSQAFKLVELKNSQVNGVLSQILSDIR